MTTVSVVIPTFNSSSTLARCLDSVLAVDALISEIIIVDGLSSDNTVEIANQYNSLFSSFTILSEPDEGISDAFNKGIKLASSEYIFLLGSDDCILEDGFSFSVFELSSTHPEIFLTPIISNCSSRVWCSNLSCIKSYNSFIHPGSFVRKDVYDNIGLYDSTFKVAMDYEFFSRAYFLGVEFHEQNLQPVVCHFSGGVSANNYICFQESFRVRKLYYSAVVPLSEIYRYLPSLLLPKNFRNFLNVTFKKLPFFRF